MGKKYENSQKRIISVTVTKRAQEEPYEPFEVSMREEVQIECTDKEADGIRLEMFDVLNDAIIKAFKEKGIDLE